MSESLAIIRTGDVRCYLVLRETPTEPSDFVLLVRRFMAMYSLPRPSVSPAVAASSAERRLVDEMGPLTVVIVSYGVHGFE